MEIDTRVSPALHPDNVLGIEGYDSEVAGYLQQTLDTFSEAYKSIKKVFDARDAAENDLTMTPEARVVRVADHADRTFTAVAAKFDKAHANLRSGIAQIERDLTAPVVARASHIISGEVRAYVKGLGTGERLSFIQQAIERGDADTVSAVLGGPSYLSGITPETQLVYLKMWHEKANPHLARRQRAMQAALDLIGDRGGLVMPHLIKAVGKKPWEVQKIRQAKSRADKAFAS